MEFMIDGIFRLCFFLNSKQHQVLPNDIHELLETGNTAFEMPDDTFLSLQKVVLETMKKDSYTHAGKEKLHNVEILTM